MQDESWIQLKLKVLGQYRGNWEKSLGDVHRLDPDFLSVDRSNIAFLVENRESLVGLFADIEAFEGLVELFAELTLQFTYKSNQFLRVSQAERDRLFDYYRGYLREMGRLIAEKDSVDVLTASMEELVEGHFLRLRGNLDRLAGKGVQPDLPENVFLSPVVCKEYSPEFQLSILGVDPAELMEPVLDIGCGSSGELVEYLRSRGIAAFGVDRVAQERDYLTRADWLELDLGVGSWGTIVSHMAFSNHFVFQHLYRFGSPEEYAREYAAILAALKPGGAFIYSPGLPFVEEWLSPDRYSVVKRPIPLIGRGDAVATISPQTLPHSVQVRRR